jgi:hypothetical protein
VDDGYAINDEDKVYHKAALQKLDLTQTKTKVLVPGKT